MGYFLLVFFLLLCLCPFSLYYNFRFLMLFFALTGFLFSASHYTQLEVVTFPTNIDWLLKTQNV